MSIPLQFNFSDGDDYTHYWSTRLSRGDNQFLQEFQSQYQIPNKNALLRFTIEFTRNHL